MASADERDLSASMGMFEAATHARPVELRPPAVGDIVVALDDSNQDATARALAARAGELTGARVHELAGAATAPEILDACRARGAGLLVLPVPFRRDITDLRDASLSSVVDMVLQGSPCPLLCARQPLEGAGVDAVFRDVLVPVLDHEGDQAVAAAWALRLVAPGGRLELLGVADRDLLGEAARLLGEGIDPGRLRAEALDRAVTADIAGLIAAVQQEGYQRGLTVHVEVKIGQPVRTAAEQANACPRLVVVHNVRDRTTLAYHHATGLILGADGPVLVVY